MADREPSAGTLAGLLLRSKAPSPTARNSDPVAPQGQLDLLFFAAPDETPVTDPKSLPVTASEGGGPAAFVSRRGVATSDSRKRIWKVQALVTDVRQALEGNYEDVWVEGEVSNCRPAPSGHVYFTLKDGDSQLSVVLFRRQASLLRFAPADGMEVLARGRISLYESRGQLQLIAETLEPRGAGSLQFAFEQLKAKLLAEGLFDAEQKRPLPQYPTRVGVITSTSGAVVHDIIRVVQRRHACLDLLIYPAAMQGPECAASVAEGIRWFNRSAKDATGGVVDLIVLARGGGSLEDLAGFNDEALARAIAVSELPVVSAIGHETDFTIADFVADLRAPTPSAAAEMITAAQHRIGEHVHGLEDRASRAIRYRTVLARQRFTRLSTAQILARLHDAMGRWGQVLDDQLRRMNQAAERQLAAPSGRLERLRLRVERAEPSAAFLSARRGLAADERLLPSLIRARLAEPASRLRHATARLEGLSPLAVLGRGYALVYAPDGTLLRDAAGVRPGEWVRARLARGALTAEVVAVEGTSDTRG